MSEKQPLEKTLAGLRLAVATPRVILLLAALLAAVSLTACRSTHNSTADDVGAPELKSEAELAAERDQRIAAGTVTPTEPVARQPQTATTEPTAPYFTPPTAAVAGSIRADILLVNDKVLSVSELLYSLRDRIADARAKQTASGFAEEIRRMLMIRTQQEIGAMLIHEEAMRTLNEQQRAILADAIDRRIKARVDEEFGGSKARFDRHLADFGLSSEQYRALLEREIVARQYTREKLIPKVSVARYEIRREYERRRSEYTGVEKREFWLIEAPFEKFLPPKRTWERATTTQRDAARAAAKEAIAQAQQALAERPFEDVAREFSKGLQASAGGDWGEISQPLMAPYDKPSALIFDMQEGAVSAPLETDNGWYIARCGKITSPEKSSFADVQDEIRQRLMEQKFTRLSAEYMIDLAESATISSLELFLQAGVQRAMAMPAAAATAESTAAQ